MRHIRPQTIRPALHAGRFLLGIFGLVFAGVGLADIIFMAAMDSNDFGTPPLFFRIVASFMGLAFAAFGGTMLYTAIRGGATVERLNQLPGSSGVPTTAGGSVGYTCPSCGASLGPKADVSPMGDVKCTFCGRWFNVHKQS